jgi:hypothetical protein
MVRYALSVILGLSMSHILWTGASAVRARRELKLHWLPFAWAACIFLQHAHFWFSALSVDLSLDGWSWTWYLQFLLLAVLLFAAGALVLPSDSSRTDDLLEDFRAHGKISLVPFVLYQLVWIPTNFRAGGSTELIHLLDPGNLANLILITLLVIAFFAKRTFVHAVVVLLFALVLTWAQAFVWSPGVFQP